MAAHDAVLFEVADRPDVHPLDARDRLRALAAAGWCARAVVVGGAPPESVPRGVSWAPDAGAAWRLAAAGADAGAGGAPRLAVVACAARGGGPLGARLARVANAAWWPTAVTAPPPTWREQVLGAGPLAVPDGAADPAAAALGRALADPAAAARPRLPLWDGDYVLVAAPATRGGLAAVIAAFAAAADPALDLVVLAARDEDAMRRARALGLATRLHFAGPAAREAQWAWLAAAGAVVLDADTPLDAGLVARALASGVTPLVAGAGEGARALRRHLAGHRLVGDPAEAVPGPAALQRALGRRADAAARAAARAAASAHAPEAVGARLARAGAASRRAA